MKQQLFEFAMWMKTMHPIIKELKPSEQVKKFLEARKVASKNFVKPDVSGRLPNAEDVKRWFQLLVGINEKAMQKDIKATLR